MEGIGADVKEIEVWQHFKENKALGNKTRRSQTMKWKDNKEGGKEKRGEERWRKKDGGGLDKVTQERGETRERKNEKEGRRGEEILIEENWGTGSITILHRSSTRRSEKNG